MAKEWFRERYRSAGYYEGGRLSEVAADGPKLLTADRGATRDQVELADSDSNVPGDQNFFVTSPIWGVTSPAGYWPWMV